MDFNFIMVYAHGFSIFLDKAQYLASIKREKLEETAGKINPELMERFCKYKYLRGDSSVSNEIVVPESVLKDFYRIKRQLREMGFKGSRYEGYKNQPVITKQAHFAALERILQ